MLPFQKKLTNSFYAILSLPATAMGFALAIQIAALSWILRTEFGFEIYQIGIVWATGPIAGIFGQVIIGVISDNVWVWNGRRRIFIFFGGTLAALMILCLPNIDLIATTMGISNMLIIAIFISLTLDLSINVSFNPTRSLIADVTPPGHPRTKGFTWMQFISGFFGVLAYVVSATLGNYVLLYSSVAIVFAFSVIPPLFIKEPRYLDADEKKIKAKRDPLLASTISLLIPGFGHFYARLWQKGLTLLLITGLAYFVAIAKMDVLWITVLFFIIAIAVHVYSIYDAFITIRNKNLEDPEYAKVYENDKTDWPQLFKLYIAHGFSWLGVQAMFVYIIFFLEDQLVPMGFENTERMIGVSFAILNTVGFLLPVLLFEPLAKRVGRVAVHTAAIASMAVAYILLGLVVRNPNHLYILMAVAGIGWGAIVSLPFAIMSEKVDPKRMGFFMGVFNLSVVIPHLVVSFVFSWIIGLFPTKNLLFILCGVMLSLSAVAWFFVKEKSPVVLDSDNERIKNSNP